MRCEDFREISDSFLKGELLVETNHEVVAHLEDCETCREELNARRILREKLRGAVIADPGAQIDPSFAARLRSELKDSIEEEKVRPFFWINVLSPKFLAAAFAGLLLSFSIAGFVFYDGGAGGSIQTKVVPAAPEPAEDLTAVWKKIAYQAIGDHRSCGLEKMDHWTKTAARESDKTSEFRKSVFQKASFAAAEPVRLLHVHDCTYDGRDFTHAVVQFGDRIVSVLLTDSEVASDANRTDRSGEPDSAIMCRKQTGFQVASFVGLNKAVFVISDLPEEENLKLARSLSNAMQS
jgi:hypothetical protein